jgi:hypothetical protein
MSMGRANFFDVDGAAVPNVTARFSSDQGSFTVVDGTTDEIYPANDGAMAVWQPTSSHFYKLEVLSAPVGYQLPSAPTYGEFVPLDPGTGWIHYPQVNLVAKKQLRINFLNARTKKRVPGATVVITVPGWDFKWTITDGGAGDLTMLGAQAAADGQVTLYMPVATLPSFQVCEQAPPTGFMLAAPVCQTVSNVGSAKSLSASFLHQTGIYVPPPPAEM